MGRDKFRFRVCYIFFNCAKLPPFCVCGRPIFIGKNVARFPNLVPQLLFFFVNLIFLIFFYFLKMSNINVDSMRKINDFKNDA